MTDRGPSAGQGACPGPCAADGAAGAAARGRRTFGGDAGVAAGGAAGGDAGGRGAGAPDAGGRDAGGGVVASGARAGGARADAVAAGLGAAVPMPGDGPAGTAALGRAVGGAAAVVAGATLASKVLGFLRDTVMAARFGSDYHTDAYIVASQVPLFLFAAVGVAIQMVFIPLFATLVARRQEREAARFAANVNGAVTLVVAGLIALIELLPGPMVTPFMTTADPVARARELGLAVRLLRIMAPLIMFYAWSGVAGGVLNARGVFGPNAAMGIPQNLTIIGTILAGTVRGARDMVVVGWGSLVGTLTTFLVQVPALVYTRFPFRWRLDLRDPLLWRWAGLVLPVVLTSLAQQSGLVVDRWLAGSRLPQAVLTNLTWASRLQALAYTVLGLSVATVIYPSLSAAEGLGDMRRFRELFARGLGLINFVTVPVMVGLFLLRTQTLRVVFQHHNFTPADTVQASYALAFFALGTLSFGWQDYLNRVFFSVHDTRTPMYAGFVAVGLNIALDLVLVGPMRQGGLALGTAAGWTAGAAYLVLRLRRRFGLMGGRSLAGSGARMLLAAVAGFLPGALLWRPAGALAQPSLPAAAALLAVALAGTLIYAGVCWVLRVPEVAAARELAAGLARRAGVSAGGR